MIKIDCKPLSVNEAWQGRRYKTKAYKAYEKEVYFKLPPIKVPEGDLRIDIEFGFSNRNSDWDNPLKLFVDILQFKYSFNDSRIYEANVKKKITKKGEEYIKFEIKKMHSLP